MINPYQKNLRVASNFLFAEETTFGRINIFMKRHMTRGFIVARGSLCMLTGSSQISRRCADFFTRALRAANLLPSLFRYTNFCLEKRALVRNLDCAGRH
jgi:hypothetical protein